MIRVIMLAVVLAGCAPPQTEPHPEPNPVKQELCPGAVKVSELACYYCTKDVAFPAYVQVDRSAIIEGSEVGVTHGRVFLSTYKSCIDLADEWDSDLATRERWE